MSPTLQDHLAFWQKIARDFELGRTLPAALEDVKSACKGTDFEPVADDLIEGVTAGNTLSAAMMQKGSVFSRCVCSMMRAGEVGGVMDVIIRRIVQGLKEGSLPLPGMADEGRDDPVRYWRAFGRLISSGVPMLEALDLVAAETAGPKLREATQSLRKAILDGKDMATGMQDYPDVFSDPVRLAAERGEREGMLDEQAFRIADALEADDQASLLRESLAANAPADVEGGKVEQYVNELLRSAVASRASDIHIDPTEQGAGRVRLRIDGVLNDVDPPPHDLYARIISRLKIMSSLDIAERAMSQDGRICIEMDCKPYDLRISVVPAVHGERVVMRVLGRASLEDLSLDAVGLDAEDIQKVRALCRLPNGIVVVNGPAGCGKTTHLYSMLKEIDWDRCCVMTVEDPVELFFPGVAQLQVKPQIGWTFARALRSVMRQDPDVVMVGELRDLEVMQLSIQLALTGHLLLTTLHAGTAVGAIRRLIDIGIEPYLINSTLAGVITPRLVRMLCPQCKQPAQPPAHSMPPEAVDIVASMEDAEFYQPQGCDHCRGTGFLGRTAIHEILIMDDRIREALTDPLDVSAVRDAARQGGMKTLTYDGLTKAARGITSVQEVLRVAPIGPNA